MATKAIINFGARHSDLFSDPVLEIGSKIQPGYAQHSPRSIHQNRPGGEYVGVDIEAGEGVDLVVDLVNEQDVSVLGEERFRTIHCHCVLEHVTDIFAMSRSIQRVLKPGGWLYLSVPFVWKIHRIPIDMWRFTPQSIDYLFPLLQFDREHCAISTRIPSELYPIDEVPELSLATLRGPSGIPLTFFMRVIRKLGLDRGYFSQRALMVECNLMMLGRKMTAPTYTFVDPAKIRPGRL